MCTKARLVKTNGENGNRSVRTNAMHCNRIGRLGKYNKTNKLHLLHIIVKRRIIYACPNIKSLIPMTMSSFFIVFFVCMRILYLLYNKFI